MRSRRRCSSRPWSSSARSGARPAARWRCSHRRSPSAACGRGCSPGCGTTSVRCDAVKVLIVSGIWPPARPYAVDWLSRAAPAGVRHTRALAAVRRLDQDADVVYSTGMFGRSGVGSLLARRPYVLKLTADPAFERARRRGLFRGSLAEFQRKRSTRTLPFRAARDAIVRRAAHVVCPSSYLAELTVGWGVPPERVDVLPNPAPAVSGLPTREDARSGLGFDAPTVVFGGRLTEQKSLGLAIEAAGRAQVRLVIAGDGPARASLEQLGGATFLGARPREQVLELFRAADASILSSSWENVPHGENGLLMPAGSADELTAAIERFFADPALAARLRANAARSVERYSRERVYGRLLEILTDAAG